MVKSLTTVQIASLSCAIVLAILFIFFLNGYSSESMQFKQKPVQNHDSVIAVAETSASDALILDQTPESELTNQTSNASYSVGKGEISRRPKNLVKFDLTGDPVTLSSFQSPYLAGKEIEIRSLIQLMDIGIREGNVDSSIATRFASYLPEYKTLVLERVKSELNENP